MSDSLQELRRLIARSKPVGLPPPALRRELRLACGLSQSDIAQAVGVDRASVSRWELGRRDPAEPGRTEYAAVLAELRGAS